MDDDAVNILISRRVKPEHHAAFEQTVREWIPRAVRFPGHLGVFMLKPAAGSDEFGALLRFRSKERWDEFQVWPAYRAFLAAIRPMLLDEPSAAPLHGMEAWFTPRGRHAPPRWKMALLTWVGVNVMVFVAKALVSAVGGAWPAAAAFLATNTIVVIALTWVVMPVLTRLARPWLEKTPA